MKIGILTAMDVEFNLVSELVADKPEFVVRKAGLGKVNAAVAAWRMIHEDGVELIVNTGCAGGVDPILSIGDVVIGTAYAYHDVWCGAPNEKGQIQGLPSRFPCEETILRKLCVAFGSDPRVKFGAVCTGDQFLESAEDDAHVKSVHADALACDMEAAAIAQVCYQNNVPFVAYKIISDVHFEADKTMQLYENFWSNLAEESFAIARTILDVIA